MDHLVTRHAATVAIDILSYSPALLIEGARQVGKSTLAQQLVADTDAIVVSLDDQDVRAAAHEDPPGFVAQGGHRCLVIDEIQRMPELTLALKSMIDRDRAPGRFILTGSSSLLRVRGLADSLAGRVGRLPLYVLSRGELSGQCDDFATAIAQATPDQLVQYRSADTREDYARMAATGGYPDVIRLTERQRRRWLSDYLQGLLHRDMPELRQLVSADRALSIMRLLASHQSGELVKAKLAQESGIPAATVTAYLDLLSDMWLMTTIPTWSPNLSQREVLRPKALILDCGLAAHLCRLGAQRLTALENRQAFGMLLEGFVTSELLKQSTWTQTDFELYHYRDRIGREVDLVMESGEGIIAVEVKAATSFQASHFQGLKFLRDKLGDRLIAGIVLNTGQQGYRFSDRLYGLPISSLWELHPTD